MKSKNLKFYNAIPIHTFKHILEICIDRAGLYQEVAEIKLTSEFISSGAEKPQGFKDVSIEKIAEYYSVPDPEKVTVNMLFDFLADKFKINSSKLKEVRTLFIEYVSLKNTVNLIDEYLNTKMATERLRFTIRDLIDSTGKNSKDRRKVDDNIDEIMQMYKSHVTGATYYKFDARSQSVLAYLTNDMREYFWKSRSADIRSLIDRKTFTKKVDGEEYDYADDLRIEKKSTKPLDNFIEHAINIHSVSAKIFKHSGFIFYDLWSYYKKSVADKRFKALKAKAKKYNLVVDFNRIFTIKDGNYIYNGNYRDNMLKTRINILQEIDRVIEYGLLKCDYMKFYESIITIDSKEEDKDNKRIFSHDPSPKRGRNYTDEELFFELLSGMKSVHVIAAHCEACGIDVLTVPSDIFVREDLIARRPSFEEYMVTYKTTEELIKQAPKQRTIKELALNEEMCKNALGLEQWSTYSTDALRRLKFSDIKDILFNVNRNSSDKFSFRIVQLAKSNENRNRYVVLQKTSATWSKVYELYTTRLFTIKNSLVDYLVDKGNSKEAAEKILFKTKDVRCASKEKGRVLRYITSWVETNESLLNVLSSQKGINTFFMQLGNKGEEVLEAVKASCEIDSTLAVNQFRYISLYLGIILRLELLYEEMLSPSTTNVSIIAIFEKYNCVLDLPSTINTASDVSDLLDSTDKFFTEKRNLRVTTKDGREVVISVITQEKVMGTIEPALVVTDNYGINDIEFTRIYKHVYNNVKQFIEPVREIRDNFYKILDANIGSGANVFGEYQNELQEVSKLFNASIPYNIDFPNSFQEYAKKSMPESVFNHSFLAIDNKPVTVTRNNYRYFVHATGQLYCPDIKDKALMGAKREIINSNDFLNY